MHPPGTPQRTDGVGKVSFKRAKGLLKDLSTAIATVAFRVLFADSTPEQHKPSCCIRIINYDSAILDYY
jgi:hypothetical protein